MNELFSLRELFDNKIFRIPDYQRGYSWSSQQLDEFFEDLVILQNNKDHYTGMISLKKLDDEYTKDWVNEKWLIDSWGYNAYHIVDGQQRLTTFIILINCIIKFYEKVNADKKADEIFINSLPLSKIKTDYLIIEKPDSDGVVSTYKFGYEVDNPSYEYFKNRILENNRSSDIQETFYTLNLENTKLYFENKIQELYDNDGIQVIEDIFLKLTRKLKFNIYYIDDDFNVYVAFETMNNRGKKLSHLELLKNRLIYLATLFNDEDASLIVRENIKDTWKTIYSYLGKNKISPLNDDEFLQAHWIMYFGYTRSNKITYDSFLLKDYFTQRRINNFVLNHIEFEEKDIEQVSNDSDQNEDIDIFNSDDITVSKKSKLSDSKKTNLSLADINNYVSSLKEMIPYWYDIQFPQNSNFSEEIKLWLNRLNRLGFLYFRPLITVILSKNDIDNQLKADLLKAIERFIFLQFRYAGYFSSYKNSFYYGLTKDLYYNNISGDKILKELNTIDILSDNKVININAILTRITRLYKNNKGYYSWASIRYFLYEYEYKLAFGKAATKLYTENFFKKDEKDKVSVEHIYPQSDSDEYWQDRFFEYTDVDKKYFLNTLGNLLPLSLSINSSLQNDSFEDKKDSSKRDRSYINGTYSEMEVAKYSEWTAESIVERGINLLSFMEERWDFKFHNREDKLKVLGLDMLIVEADKNIDLVEVINEEEMIKRSERDKWNYNGDSYTNVGLVRKLINDYCVSNNIKSYNDIPDDIKTFKMYHKNLIIDGNDESGLYVNEEINGMDLLIRKVCYKDETLKFIEVLKEYFTFDVELITSVEKV